MKRNRSNSQARSQRRLMLWTAVLPALLVGLATAAQAQADDTISRAGSIAPEHRVLAALEGDYRLTAEFWPAEETAPEVTVLPARRRLILGGRVLQLEVGELDSGFRGTGLSGYDATSGRFWYVWTDTSHTGVAQFQGELSVAGEGVLVGEAPTPSAPTPMRIAVSHLEGSEVHEYFVPANGHGERRYLRLRYERRSP